MRDHGGGLPDGAADQVFDRFWSGGQAAGPAGAAPASASRSSPPSPTRTAAAPRRRNAPDGGAVFTVTLPRRALVPAGQG